MIWRWLPKDKSSKVFKGVKMIADLSSVLCVVIGWLWAFAYRRGSVNSVKLVGLVDTDGFMFAVPGKGFYEDMKPDVLVSSALIITIVGFLETVAVGGKFAMQARYEYDPNQELIALGLANVAGALMAGYPVTGSFSRTAVNAMFGATSLFACFLSSLLVVTAMYILLGIIANLPLASLAPIIIQGAIGVVNMHEFKVAWAASRTEFLVMFSTFVVSLGLTVKEGLLVGFLMSVLKTMNELANPNLAVLGQLKDGSFRDVRNFQSAVQFPNAVVVRMDARLNFANARKMKEFCLRALQVRERQALTIKYVVIDAKSINHIDLTGCEMLEVLADSLNDKGQHLVICNLKGPVSSCLQAAGTPKRLAKHGGLLCTDMDQALGIMRGRSSGIGDMLEVLDLAKRYETAKSVLSQSQSPFCRGHQHHHHHHGSGSESSLKSGSGSGIADASSSPKQTPSDGGLPEKIIQSV
jgi:SulP family sulfate permease